MKVKGKVNWVGSTKLNNESDTPDAPQGEQLVLSYDASLNSFPTSQGWTGPNTGSQLITDTDNKYSLRKVSQSDAPFYTGVPLDPGWLVDLNIKVDTNPGTFTFVHMLIVVVAGDRRAFEFLPDSIAVYSGLTQVKIADYDFQSDYVDVKLLHNTETGFVELYLDGVLIADDISEQYGNSTRRTLWGDGSAGGGGYVAFWRKLDTYNGWTV